MKVHWSSKIKFLVTFLCSLLILASFGYFVTGGIFFEILDSIGSISYSRSSLLLLEKRKLVAKENEVKLSVIAADVERFKKTFLDRERPLDFIEALETVARLSGSPIEITPLEKSGVITNFILVAKGEFQNLFKFLKLLETMPYFISIEDMNFVRSSTVEEFLADKTAQPASMRLNLIIKAETN